MFPPRRGEARPQSGRPNLNEVPLQGRTDGFPVCGELNMVRPRSPWTNHSELIESMHLLLKLKDLFQTGFGEVLSPLDSYHQFAENFEVIPFRRKSQWILPKKWNDDFLKLFSVEHFETIAIVMIFTRIFLEINTTTSKIIAQCIEN